MAQLKAYYQKEVVPALIQQFSLDNPMRVPKITKVTLNMGLGEAVADKKILEAATADLEKISGQRVVVTKARKSIAGFKIRKVGQSDARLPSAVNECMSFWSGWSIFLSRASGTSAV